ncbi:universal stress protein [Halogeometricum limi]|uniref:Nucleotide-binding universal stress protein, UspA family n=1 Tax=Halogeometricum limi TaxID=555875 RepID=A0A1I6IAE1_9EURY|nr:universal stress protein [Halogeometricum limi]SFR63653.1 Nucleotide-binding universal stress protein, UspA family [Halogeometricum limi]
MYDRVLITTDGTECSVTAAAHGLALADAFDAEVHVVTVVDVQAAGGVFDAGGLTADFVEALDARAKKQVEAVASNADPATTVHTEILKGTPSNEILRYARENDADLLVLGTHGRSGVRRVITGSVAERVVRLADVPVLTVREREETSLDTTYDRILVATDASEDAEAAVEHALSLAARFDAEVHVLYVVDTSVIRPKLGNLVPETVRSALETVGKEALAAAEARAEDVGVDAVTEMVDGVPSRKILSYADENGADVVVVGTHGRTGVDRLLLGSTTERILRSASTPVLSVRRGDENGDE